MDFLLHSIISYLLLYKYFTIFVVSFLAAFILPIPSGSMMMAAAAFSSQGYFDLKWIIILSIIANIAGDNLGYYLAQHYGRKTLHNIGFKKVLDSENFKKVEKSFKKHPGLIVFISRFEVLSTLSVNLLSGIGKITYKKFLAHEAAGTVAQVFMYSMIGYVFGDNWQSVNTIIGKFLLVLLFLMVFIVIAFGKKILARMAE
jgi:membrane protein DedA with SNARE-associated domain